MNPQKLFLTDSLGALLSAIMLGLVLPRLESIFGMPQLVLYWLASIAGIFFIHSLLCFLRKPANWRPSLRIIALANLSYCCLTVGLIIYWFPMLTVLGLAYFALEIIVVMLLSLMELKAARVYK
ncbi:MAG: hypothetical protein KF852_05415 [Saprospiraceae bacterium]|nr:hypothetical protein [Saprospiraceae bacterium]